MAKRKSTATKEKSADFYFSHLHEIAAFFDPEKELGEQLISVLKILDLDTPPPEDDNNCLLSNIWGYETTGKTLTVKVLYHSDEKTNDKKPVSIYPSSRYGVAMILKILRVEEIVPKQEAYIYAETLDGVELAFFDLDYSFRFDEYEEGDYYEFMLCGFAYDACIKEQESERFTLKKEECAELANVLKDMFGDDQNLDCDFSSPEFLSYLQNSMSGEHTIDNTKMAIYLPLVENPTAVAISSFRSPILGEVKLRRNPVGVSMYELPISLYGGEIQDSLPMLPLFAKTSFFKKRPKTGQVLEGVLQIVGRCID